MVHGVICRAKLAALLQSWNVFHVPVDNSRDYSHQQAADGRRQPEEEGRLLGAGDDDQVGPGARCEDLGLLRSSSEFNDLLDSEKFVDLQ